MTTHNLSKRTEMSKIAKYHTNVSGISDAHGEMRMKVRVSPKLTQKMIQDIDFVKLEP